MDLKPGPSCGVMIRSLCFPDDKTLSQAVRDALVQAFAGPYSVPTGIMLAGGSTPLAAYSLMAAQPLRIDPMVRVLFSDDRHVPPDHPQSNYRNISPFLHKAGLSETQILRIQGEWPLEEAVRDYQQKLEAFYEAGGKISFGLLGLGADGHTASLFNANDLARGKDVFTIGVQRPDGLQGVSVTPTVLSRMARLIFVVSGTGKKAMAGKLARAPQTITAGQAVAGHRGVELWTDKEAWPF